MISRSREKSYTMDDLEKKNKRKQVSQVSPNVTLKTGDLAKNLAKAKKQFSKRSHSSLDRARDRSKS